MRDLVFIAFPSRRKAKEVRGRIVAMRKGYLIELGEAEESTLREALAYRAAAEKAEAKADPVA